MRASLVRAGLGLFALALALIGVTGPASAQTGSFTPLNLESGVVVHRIVHSIDHRFGQPGPCFNRPGLGPCFPHPAFGPRQGHPGLWPDFAHHVFGSRFEHPGFGHPAFAALFDLDRPNFVLRLGDSSFGRHLRPFGFGHSLGHPGLGFRLGHFGLGLHLGGHPGFDLGLGAPL